MYGFHDFETATKLAEQKTNETGKPYCVLHAEDVDGPGGMFTLGVYPHLHILAGASTNPLQPVVRSISTSDIMRLPVATTISPRSRATLYSCA